MNKIVVHILFIAGVLGGGLLIGSVSMPDAWYQTLAKPSFDPPGWLFGPVWSILYILIGIAGARTWIHHRGSTAMRFWLAQMALNFLWPPVFFILHSISSALVVIIALLIAIVGFIVTSRRQDRIAALLFVPYLAWVCFATLLNGAILYLN